MILQPIVNIAEICARHAIKQAIICPGSRNALLTLAFARHPDIQTFVIPDERSAGFIGLGLAQSSKKPVAVICTSGTAAANLYPSIIEAFYQHVPILILTADRPPEWIDQQDGQAIRQQNLYENHILKSFQFPSSFDSREDVWHSGKIVSEAILLATGTRKGPVHINVPIREPFYPDFDEEFFYEKSAKLIAKISPERKPSPVDIKDMVHQAKNHEKIMIIVGQGQCDVNVIDLMRKIQKHLKWVVVGDVISNINQLEHAISHHDIILSLSTEMDELKPDLLITLGQSVVSKNLKKFIRNHKPKEHWHIGECEDVIDTYKSLTKKILLNSTVFLQIFEDEPFPLSKIQNNYFNHWKERELQAIGFVNEFLSREEFSEFHAVWKILQKLPDKSDLHLANSMPVRYANFIGINHSKEIRTWANRGTSGIDGSISTFVGHALNSKSLHILLTGDLSFFYDRNALWHNHLPDNLRIVILNNHGGGIFRLIDGPKHLDELEEYFETHQKLNAANTARDFGLNYFIVKTLEALPDILDHFFTANSGASILEIETDPKVNQKVFEEFKAKSIDLWK